MGTNADIAKHGTPRHRRYYRHELRTHGSRTRDDGKSSVKAVRLAGKFMGAMEQARAALGAAK